MQSCDIPSFKYLIDNTLNLETETHYKMRPIHFASKMVDRHSFLLASAGAKIDACTNPIIKELLEWIPDFHKKFGKNFNSRIKMFLLVRNE